MSSRVSSQQPSQQVSPQLMALMIASLVKMKPELAASVSVDTMDSVQLQALKLDSLDTLEWAMEIEKSYDVEIEAVDFDPKLTLSGLALELQALKQAQQQGK